MCLQRKTKSTTSLIDFLQTAADTFFIKIRIKIYILKNKNFIRFFKKMCLHGNKKVELFRSTTKKNAADTFLFLKLEVSLVGVTGTFGGTQRGRLAS